MPVFHEFQKLPNKWRRFHSSLMLGWRQEMAIQRQNGQFIHRANAWAAWSCVSGSASARLTPRSTPISGRVKKSTFHLQGPAPTPQHPGALVFPSMIWELQACSASTSRQGDTGKLALSLEKTAVPLNLSLHFPPLFSFPGASSTTLLQNFFPPHSLPDICPTSW